MSKTEEATSLLLSQYEQLQKLYIKKNNDLSEIDKELSTIYHFIEGVELNHVSKSNLLKQLKDILIRRRDIKYERILLSSVIDTLGMPIIKVKNAYAKAKNKHQEILELSKKTFETK